MEEKKTSTRPAQPANQISPAVAGKPEPHGCPRSIWRAWQEAEATAPEEAQKKEATEE